MMPAQTMQYIIFVKSEEDGYELYAAPVDAGDIEFLRDEVVPTLRPMTDDEYMGGPSVILHTMARFSYILFEDDVLWCAEWDPGLVVVRFSPDGTITWTALRSPIPEFGGRTPTQEDVELFDEEADNHQYNLVFTAWDAQSDAQDRIDFGFAPIDAPSKEKYISALDHVNELAKTMEKRYADSIDQWAETCKQNLSEWAGDGIRTS